MPDGKYQFGLRELLLATTAVAIACTLLIAALAQQSTFLLFCAALMFGVSGGGSLGFALGGRPGIPIGAFLGAGIMFFLYSASVRTIG